MNLLKSLLLGRLLFAEIQVPYFERGKGQASISISKNWQVLGPFQIGTRGIYTDIYMISVVSLNGRQKPHGVQILWSISAVSARLFMTPKCTSVAHLE